MTINPIHHKPIPFIRELCKGLLEEEMVAAEVRFMEYLRIVQEIFLDRITKGQK
jgi:hypothetical protein